MEGVALASLSSTAGAAEARLDGLRGDGLMVWAILAKGVERELVFLEKQFVTLSCN